MLQHRAARLSFAVALALSPTLAAQTGTVASHARIAGDSGLIDALDDGDEFGNATAGLGDLDGDGLLELAIGAPMDDGPGSDRGSVHIVHLAADGSIAGRHKISSGIGGFTGHLDDSDWFGSSVCALGDLDGDGVGDLTVGAAGDDDGGADFGAVWILFLHADGTVKAQQKISATSGGLVGALIGPKEEFGGSVAALGDLDGNGVLDLAVGAPSDSHGLGESHRFGAVFILFLNSNGTVQSWRRIGESSGGFTGVLEHKDFFGVSVTAVGDLDADGVTDLAVGSPGDDDGGSDSGAVWIVFLHGDGTVKSQQLISDTSGGFEGSLFNTDQFGRSVAALGDLDGDGQLDLAVSAPAYSDPIERVWVLFLQANGTVKAKQEISTQAGGFGGTLDSEDEFGWAVAAIGDVDGDRIVDLAVGASWDDDGGTNRGATWVLFLQTEGKVSGQTKLSELTGGLPNTLEPGDNMGDDIASLGDLDGDGVTDLAIGASGDDDGDLNAGAVWILFMQADGGVRESQHISALAGGFGGSLSSADRFGQGLAAVGDLDGDGVGDLAVGAAGDDDGGTNRGAVWILFLNSDGTVKDERKLSALSGGFTGTLDDFDAFGTDVAGLGDLDGDGVGDLVVGAPGDDDGGGTNRGAVWVLFLHTDGTVKTQRKISSTSGGFAGVLIDNAKFGDVVAGPGDVNGDGVADLAVIGGAVWIVFLHADGTVAGHSKIANGIGGFTPGPSFGGFGSSMATLGDLDGAGALELAVGAQADDDGGPDRGAVWILFLAQDGTVNESQKLSNTVGGFTGTLLNNDALGASVAGPGDLNGDCVPDLVAGAPGDDLDGTGKGAAWVMFLNRTPWASLGSGLAGLAGVPHLVGAGSLQPVTSGSLSLTGGKPSTLAMLFASVVSVPLPFKGGTLVPVPPLLQVALFTNGAGAITLPFTWPNAVPSGLSIYMQIALQDAAAINGVSLSNAVRGKTP